MEISKRVMGSGTAVEISGRIVAGECLLLRKTIRSLIAAGEKEVVIDLKQVPYIDSAGIGELVSALVAVEKSGGTLRLVNLTRRVRDVLKLVKLLHVFQVFETEEEALTNLGPRQLGAYRAAARAS